MLKDMRIRKIELSIKKNLFSGIVDMKNESMKTMLVGVQEIAHDSCHTFSQEHKILLDSLLAKAQKLHRLYMQELYCHFSKDPALVANLFGKQDKNGKWKFTANDANGKKFKESFKPKISDKSINQCDLQTNSAFTESVMMSIGKDVAGFLDKYFSIQDEIKKINEQNKDKIGKISKNINYPKLPDKFATRQEVDAYNSAISQINMVINEKVNQVSDKDNQIEYLKRLKGFPSFPLVEKIGSDLDEPTIKNKLNEAFTPLMADSKKFWESLNGDELTDILDKNYDSDYKVKGEIGEFFRKTFAYHKDMNTVYEIVLAKVQKKIDKLEKYVSTNDDAKARRKYWEWNVGKSMILLEHLRKDDFDKFIQIRANIDFLISTAKGLWFKKSDDKLGLEITGFSAQKMAMLALFDHTDKSGKTHQQWALVFNHFKEEKDSAKKELFSVKGYIANKLVTKEIDLNKWVIIPLAFGKHYGRQYLYNNVHNLDNEKMCLNNARVIKQDSKYWVALTFTKKELQGYNDFDGKYEYIIGIDRGEKIPVVATITDLTGRRIKTVELGVEHYKKQKEIATSKAEQQAETGRYSDKLAHRAKNISNKTIERIVIDLLYLANEHRGLLVMDDLSRGFGRQGKKTIVSNNQYTHIEDLLAEKLKTNGLSRKGKTVLNCRDGLVAKVQAAHTSLTCSSCGYVHRKENIEIDKIKKKNGIWHIEMCDKTFSLDVNYHGYKGRKENANDKTNELVNDKEISELSNTNKYKIQKIIKSALSPRKSQESFLCPICGYSENADANASLNIARRWIFEKGDEVDVMKDGSFVKTKKYLTRNAKKTEDDKTSYIQSWADYCRERSKIWNTQNS